MITTLFDVETTPEAVSAGRKAGGARHAANLAAVLGNGAEWEYRGECCDLGYPTGKCACGQIGLRFEFTIHHPDGRRAIVGSSCILSYDGVTPELAERLAADVERLQAEGRERERKAREAARAAEVVDLMRQWSEAEYLTDTAAAAWRNNNPRPAWEPHAIYKRGAYKRRLDERPERDAAGELHPYCRLPALKTTAGQIKRLREYLTVCARELETVRNENR